MFAECRKTIKESIPGTFKGNIHTSRKTLKRNNESRVAAVLFEEDDLEKDGSKRLYMDENGRHKRRRKYKRKLAFSVVLGEYSIEKVEEMYDSFLQNLPDGIYVNGNYVSIEPTNADWLDDEDNIMKAKCAVQVKVVCDGGIYKDSEFIKISEVDIIAGKE